MPNHGKNNEVFMKIRYRLVFLVGLLIHLSVQGYAQPFYYYTDTTDLSKFLRFDLTNGIKTLFNSDSVDPGGDVSWDPTQSYVYISGSIGDRDSTYNAMRMINTGNSTITHYFPDQLDNGSRQSFTSFYFPNFGRGGGKFYDGIVYNPVRNSLYVTWTTKTADSIGKWNDFLDNQKTVVYNATSLKQNETLLVPPGWINGVSSVSDDGNYLYLEKWDYQQAAYVGKYSLDSKQIIRSRDISEIYVQKGDKDIEDSKKGFYLLLFIYPGSDLVNKQYVVYNIDRDSTYAIIPFPQVSHGHISSNGKYVIVEETPLRPDYQTASDEFYHPGRISVFSGLTGQLIQKLTLPPDGKVLVFDNYPNMLYYYLPNENRSINIDLSKLTPPSGCNVKLVSSSGAKLTGGALQYYEGSWKDAVNNNDGTFTIATSAKTLSLRMTYEYGTQTKSNVIVSYDTVVFQTVNAQIQLQNSSGVLIDTGSVQYYAGAWRNLGTTINGIATKELLPASYSFRMTYAYASKDQQQDISTNPVVVFQTVNAAVQLQNSQGSLIDQGTVQYYSGAWRDLGTTSNGVANKELLPNSYSFRMTYAYASKDKQQDLNTNPTVVFQTVNVAVQLKNSLGNLIDQGTVQYYSGAWRDLGATTNGVANKELLPNNYSFRMTYAFASKDQQQDISTNSTVVFRTVNAAVQLQNSQGSLIDQGTVQYYSGAWRDLGTTTNGVANKELLPNNYSFRMSYAYASKDKQQDISTNATVVFQTINAAVQLQNSSGALMDTGTVQYYSGAWRSFGTTTSGVANKELLPNSYSFRMTHAYVSLDKTQDISTNNTVSFSTVLCTVKVSNSLGQLVNGALASYYSGSWRQIGNTVSGVITKELLPVSLSFRVKYGTQQIDKQQNLSTNNLVEFVIP